MSAEFLSKLDSAALSIIKTAEFAKKYNIDEKQNPKLYINLINEISLIKHDTQETAKLNESGKILSTVSEFEKLVSSSERKKRNYKNTNDHKMLVKKINEIFSVHDDDSSSDNIQYDDDVVMENVKSYDDPITKRRIVHPVKNKLCGHRYDKETILQVIDKNPYVRCPVAGCGNKQYITKRGLEEDIEFALKLKKSPKYVQ